MFSAANGKIKLPSEDTALVTSPLRCLFNGPFRDLHFNVSGDHRLIPVHDVVFLDDFERNVKPLIYRPVTSETFDSGGGGGVLLASKSSEKPPHNIYADAANR
ncbi:eye-specific diacylglycerol kinase [Drosophila madeirensis]|uniref:Eye-specific diacylglycerol kinase n=1 Tax=Drosophila madeirensis TaxID=30013 RepID=A0AAU9G0H3_DROMD